MGDYRQLSWFEGDTKLSLSSKPIRLIELFGGVGAQAKAMERLDAEGLLPNGWEHYRLVEWDKYPVASYNAVHGTEFSPMDITKTHADDLGIVDTDRYNYIMCYSFPCQDLSSAGKGRGMSRGGGTRSGLLWEVERLLHEMHELPQVLLMENVPQVCGEKNRRDFREWIQSLENLGYTSKYQIMNAVDYGVPQNRERCFMVSWLGDYYYEFPDPWKLTECMGDRLEEQVDEKYYLSDEAVIGLIQQTENFHISLT